MKTRLAPVIVSVVIAAACGGPPSTEPLSEVVPDEGGTILLLSQDIIVESGGCAEDESTCARVEVSTMATSGGGTEAVRDNIDLYLIHDLVSRLRSFVPEEVGNRLTQPGALSSAFIDQHRAFVDEFPDSTAAWFVKIDTEAIHNTPDVCTISVSETAYTGGAHPNQRRRLVSFDVLSGQLLGADDLTRDPGALAALVERQLRSDHGLGPDDDLAAAGFWISDEGLRVPDNLGIVAEGLLVHWDPYEIAPYSMGPVDVTVPAAELDGIIDGRYR